MVTPPEDGAGGVYVVGLHLVVDRIVSVRPQGTRPLKPSETRGPGAPHLAVSPLASRSRRGPSVNCSSSCSYGRCPCLSVVCSAQAAQFVLESVAAAPAAGQGATLWPCSPRSSALSSWPTAEPLGGAGPGPAQHRADALDRRLVARGHQQQDHQKCVRGASLVRWFGGLGASGHVAVWQASSASRARSW